MQDGTNSSINGSGDGDSIMDSLPDQSRQALLEAKAVEGIPTQEVGINSKSKSKRKDHPYLVSYLNGQLASVCMFGTWWVLLSPITIAFFGNEGVGISRMVFNIALFLLSLVAGSIAESTRIFDLLARTTVGRIAIYSLLLPLGAFLLQSNIIIDIHAENQMFYSHIFEVLFMVCIFLDGILVAAANVIAVDYGGIDICAAQYGIDFDENLRGRFTSIWQATFDGSMVLLAPLVAVVSYLFNQYSPLSTTAATENNNEDTGDDIDNEANVIADALLMTSCLGIAFLLLGSLAMAFYSRLPRNPSNFTKTYEEKENESSVSSPSLIKQLCTTLHDYPCIISSIWNNKIIFWRIIFTGVETGLEDAMIAVIVPLYCNQIACNALDVKYSSTSQEYLQECLHDSFALRGNIYIALAVALGKVGAVLAGYYMHSKFVYDEEKQNDNGQQEQVEEQEGSKKYRSLFWWSLFGGLSALLVPSSLYFVEHYFDSSSYSSKEENADRDQPSNNNLEYYAILLLCPCIFIFNFLTTVPKIGFMTLLQTYVGKEANGLQIFGLCGAFTTLADAVVVTILSFISPPYLNLTTALWYGCGLYACVGIFEGIYGPQLVLGTTRGKDAHSGYTELSQGEDEENQKSIFAEI